MKLILAGNYKQFMEVAEPEDKYLGALPEDLLGHQDCDLIVEGTYWLRADFKPLEIYYYCKSHNIKLPEVLIRMAGEKDAQ